MKISLVSLLIWLISLPALLIGLVRQFAIWVATKRWYLIGFIPCNAGFWPLGLHCWEMRAGNNYLRLLLRLFSIGCLLVGTFLFFAGLWVFALILLFIRLLIWIDRWFQLDKPLSSSGVAQSSLIFHNPFDRICLIFILIVFVILAINKHQLADMMENPSDNYYHMAVAQKILERGEIPLWDDWEFAPMGRPHLYPPLIHLIIAFFAKEPEQIRSGFATLQILLYPLALFSYWMLYRYLMGSALAYIALLFLCMEFMFTMGCLLGLPASLVNVFLPWILLALLKNRTYVCMFLLTLAFYTHTGMPVLISLGLVVFGLLQRKYFWRVVYIVLGALALSSLWSVRYIAFSDWMHSGGVQGYSIESILSRLLWLQILNPILLLLALWGLLRCKMSNLTILKSQIIGFLPMLTQYGGRYMMHGAPLLSPWIAWNFRHMIHGSISRRRVLGFSLIALIPLPCINFIGEGDAMQPKFMVAPTAVHGALVFVIHHEKRDNSDLEKLITMIRETTAEDDVLLLPDLEPHFANFLNVMTYRRTDMGGWGEIRKDEMWETIVKNRENPRHGVFVAKSKESIPDNRRIEKIGSYYIGYPINQREQSVGN